MISVALSTPPKWSFVSWGIKAFTSSDVSHASIHFPGDGVLSGHTMILESGAHGVVLVPSQRWEPHNKVLYRFVLKDTQLGLNALRILLMELGAEYDFAGIARFAWYLIWKKVSVRVAECCVRNTPDRLFCSEVVARWIQIMAALCGSVQRFPEALWRPDLVSPEDLKKLKSSGEFEMAYANPG